MMKEKGTLLFITEDGCINEETINEKEWLGKVENFLNDFFDRISIKNFDDSVMEQGFWKYQLLVGDTYLIKQDSLKLNLFASSLVRTLVYGNAVVACLDRTETGEMDLRTLTKKECDAIKSHICSLGLGWEHK